MPVGGGRTLRDADDRWRKFVGQHGDHGFVEHGHRPLGLAETHEDLSLANPAEGRISNESPVGRALLGHRKGEKVQVSVPAGSWTYKIVSIS